MCTKRKLVLLVLQPFQQFSVFTGELRLLCAKSGAGQLPGGRDDACGQEKGTTVDEMAGWHHRRNGHESE